MTEEKLITLIDAAKIVGCSTSTLRRYAELGESIPSRLPAEKYGNQWLIMPSKLNAWIANGHYKPNMKRR